MLKSLIDIICNIKPFNDIRKKCNRKIDAKLTNIIKPIIPEIDVIKNNLLELSSIKDQLHVSINSLQQQINDVHLYHDACHRQTRDLLHQLHEENNLNYPGLHAALFPTFYTVIEKISGAAYPTLPEVAHLILLEVAKEYQKLPGGIWRLHAEINTFATPKPTPPNGRDQAVPVREGCLKLLVISGMFPSIEHGGGLRLFDILTTLASSGHEIDLFTVYAQPHDQYSLGLLQDKVRQIKLVTEEEFTASSLQTWLSDMGRITGYYDAIQCEYPLSAKLLAEVRSFGRRIGFTFMECITKSFLIKLANSLADNDFVNLGQQARCFWEFAVAENIAARHTDFQIAVTPEDAKEIERLTSVCPTVIPTCLSPSQIIAPLADALDTQPEGNTVVFLGYFNHFPNIDGVLWYLNTVHPMVKNQVPDYRFLVVGAGDTQKLKTLSQRDPSVVYTGRVDDIITYIRRGKVCVLPLISGAGIRGKLNQYSIAGRPSVSTRIGNMGLNYPDGEAILIADQPADFAKAVVRLLTDYEFNRSVAKLAKTHAQANFTWDKHIFRLLELYHA